MGLKGSFNHAISGVGGSTRWELSLEGVGDRGNDFVFVPVQSKVFLGYSLVLATFPSSRRNFAAGFFIDARSGLFNSSLRTSLPTCLISSASLFGKGTSELVSNVCKIVNAL